MIKMTRNAGCSFSASSCWAAQSFSSTLSRSLRGTGSSMTSPSSPPSSCPPWPARPTPLSRRATGLTSSTTAISSTSRCSKPSGGRAARSQSRPTSIGRARSGGSSPKPLRPGRDRQAARGRRRDLRIQPDDAAPQVHGLRRRLVYGRHDELRQPLLRVERREQRLCLRP